MHKVSKIEAWEDWKPHIDEVSLDLDKSVHAFNFNRRWFVNRNQKTFSMFLPPRFADTPTKMIQIGVFEGMDLCWQFQHVLTHPRCRAVAIDPWAATRKLDADWMEGCYERARHNLKPWQEKLEIRRGYSDIILQQLIDDGEEGKFDYAIIDGDHTADAVFKDAELCLQLVKRGGWLLFDDVRNQQQKKDHVEAGLHRFLDTHEGALKRVAYHRFCDIYEVL